MPRTIRTEIQKRFSDIDSFRHVNNVSQQMYFDVGKSDFFDRLLGPEILFAPVRIITAATDTSYMGQIRFEDRIAVTTCVERIGTKSLTLLQRIDPKTARCAARAVRSWSPSISRRSRACRSPTHGAGRSKRSERTPNIRTYGCFNISARCFRRARTVPSTINNTPPKIAPPASR